MSCPHHPGSGACHDCAGERTDTYYRDTSRQAYKQALRYASQRESEVMTFLSESADGATVDEFTEAKDPTAGHNAYAPRFTSLIQKGIIYRSKQTRLTRAGRRAAVHYLRDSLIPAQQPTLM